MSNNPREIAPPHSRPLTKIRLRCSYAGAIALGTQSWRYSGWARSPQRHLIAHDNPNARSLTRRTYYVRPRGCVRTILACAYYMVAATMKWISNDLSKRYFIPLDRDRAERYHLSTASWNLHFHISIGSFVFVSFFFLFKKIKRINLVNINQKVFAVRR